MVLCLQIALSTGHAPLLRYFPRLMRDLWLPGYGEFFESRAILLPIQYGFRNGLGTCNAVLHVAHVIQVVLNSGAKARLVQIDFSAAFNRVNHAGITYKLKFV